MKKVLAKILILFFIFAASEEEIKYFFNILFYFACFLFWCFTTAWSYTHEIIS